MLMLFRCTPIFHALCGVFSCHSLPVSYPPYVADFVSVRYLSDRCFSAFRVSTRLAVLQAYWYHPPPY